MFAASTRHDADGPAPVVRRGRGRPSVLDAEAVVGAAFELWNEKGFAATSWADLAEATGISARTLMRHYPSKHAIAWHGVAPATERLRASLAAAPASASVADAIRTAVVESVTHRPFMPGLSRSWLRLMLSEPELAAMAPRAHLPWIEEIAAFISARLDAPAGVCRALGATYEAAAFAALREWAETDVGDPADAVDEVLRWIDIHLPHPPRA
ncbi:TetR family transcriptional regulator [Gordonia pseudamarae]|jgi:AcrR family transcriptional regulator|uniref:TetR family transcriptional regulator n=1 Tax=Gordonia pseudamarae TaxID=2831662 RepID=A0ABX6IP43_9ACTN|nr:MULTISPECIES: TetR/AcrR family transcriptional regulator [Gordonia]MBD0022180.1 TetR family transcriptional regulator [Gordonia sp. (in: high G+C Gram-positive bacteria)]QHN28195.1 TetR family transcriptional regulator [Gordonia pseudamarae]QHN37056.1 TetR family transcriptional regulator [Gordonia pseudamarae]